MSLTFGALLLVTSLLAGCVWTQDPPHHYDLEANPNLCNFFDTINITDGIRNKSDNSITFNNIRYAEDHYGTFNFTYLPNQLKINIAAHIRGCVCHYTNCVRLCCPYGYSFYDVATISSHMKSTCVHNEKLNSINANLLHDGEIKEIDLMHNLNITLVTEKPCKTAYFLDPMMPEDKWIILSNGSIIVGPDTDDAILENHNGYCLGHVFDPDSNQFNVKAMLCSDSVELSEQTIIGLLIYPAVMLVSVVFLLITLFVYIWIEELRQTIHGKNLMCYLLTLIVGYSVLAYTHIDNSHAMNGPLKCKIIAEIIHTAFICGFIWLSIISFDIWRTIGRTDNHRNQFFVYCIYASGLTILIVSVTNLLDYVDILPTDFRPGLGTTVCWLQDTKYAHFLYLYALIIIVITVNGVLFLLTKLKIEWVKRISDRATNCEGSRKFSREETDADRFGLFLRLFIIMGLPWILEIISWLLDAEHIIIYILDILTMLQGPVIFFLFIKKRRVKKLIKRNLSLMSRQSNKTNRSSFGGGNSSSAMTTVSGLKLDDVKLGH